jgi:hypothetical protein
MSIKDQMNTQDWANIVQVPFVAGFAVSAADPSGLIGAFQESAALAKSVQKAASEAGEQSIPHAIMEELKTSDGRGLIRDGVRDLTKGMKPAEASDAAVARLTETLALVRDNAPDQFAPVVELVRAVSQNVAQAAKEGGFLGFGGEPVSEAEYKTLEDIETAIASVASGA